MNQDVHQTHIVITGVNGFVGKHLVAELRKHNITVSGVGREERANPAIADQLESYYTADLAKEWPKIHNISAVIHLAGLAAVGPSFDIPQAYINLNSAMVTHMCEFYLKVEQKPRLIVVSSGAIYSADQPMPLTEKSAVGFSSPYAVSKILVENQCSYYRNRGLDCVIARPFNHVGPGQLEGFLVPEVVKQLKEGDSVTVGNITTKRDYTDVRDVARAYQLLATTKNLAHTKYNVCSGKSTSGQEIVATLKNLCQKPSAEIIVDQSKVRPTDPAEIFGDFSALHADTGWSPKIDLTKTLSDCIES